MAASVPTGPIVCASGRCMHGGGHRSNRAGSRGPISDADYQACLAKERPDQMLVDWNMPNMDGITLIRKVRETDKDLPIIMVTTEAEKTRVIEAVEAGVNNYIVKPFTADTRSEKINQTMSKMAASAS